MPEAGLGTDWPSGYKDIAPWYDYVGDICCIRGTGRRHTHLPDSVFLPPMEMNALKKHFTKGLINNHNKEPYG